MNRSSQFAVVMNSTRDSQTQVEVMIGKRDILLGSSTSSNAAAGSPRKSAPILSNSSIKITGLRLSTRRSVWMIRPASHRRKCACGRESRPHLACREREAREFPTSASATLLPSDVLPTPGGPTRQRMGPLICLRRLMTAINSSKRSLIFSRRNAARSKFFRRLQIQFILGLLSHGRFKSSRDNSARRRIRRRRARLLKAFEFLPGGFARFGGHGRRSIFSRMIWFRRCPARLRQVHAGWRALFAQEKITLRLGD